MAGLMGFWGKPTENFRGNEEGSIVTETPS